MKPCYRHALMIVMCLSLFAASVGIAAELPPNATKDEDISAVALTKATEQFAALKTSLEAQAADESLPPDQKEMITQMLAVIDEKLQNLASIEVYFVQESEAGAAYDDVYTFYKDKLSNFMDVGSEEIQFALMEAPLPPDAMPQATLDALNQMAADGKARAAIGNSGKSRISILTFYLNPNTLELIQKTTVVVATNK